MPVILVTWEAEIGKIPVWGQRPPFQNNQSKMDWECAQVGWAPALQVWGPEFYTPAPQNKMWMTSFGRWMDKVLHTEDRIVFSVKKEWAIKPRKDLEEF
jgi:hypothetical protein